MYYSKDLEYIVTANSYGFSSQINYFSRKLDDNYSFSLTDSILSEPQYRKVSTQAPYTGRHEYSSDIETYHSFTPDVFLNASRPTTRFVDDNDEIRSIAEETFTLMTKDKLPDNISINVLALEEFKSIHSRFGSWSSGILGFSINGANKKIFVLENSLDTILLVVGHEIGHVLTDSLANRHDEEAKAFAFSIEWVNTIKKHNVANLGISIRDKMNFQPAGNGLHDIAFSFVSLMLNKGRKAIELHNDLARKYLSMFDLIYEKFSSKIA